MKVKAIKPSAALWTPEEEFKTSMKMIERAARNCYDSNHLFGTNPNFVRNLTHAKGNKRPHIGPIEHRNATFLLTMSRTASHQLVRHRVGTTFDQRSQRYVDPFKKDGFIEVICPPSILTKGDEAVSRWLKNKEKSLKFYCDLIDSGVPKEDARESFPNAIATFVAMTANLRTWRHIFEERALNPAAQWQIRGVTQLCLVVLNYYLPDIYYDQFERLLSFPDKRQAWRHCELFIQNIDNGFLSDFAHLTGYDYKQDIESRLNK